MLKLGWFGVSLFKDTSIYVDSYTVYMLYIYIYCIDMYVYGWDVWHFFVLRKLGVREKFAKNRFPGSWAEGAEGALSDVGLTAVWLWASYPPVSTWLENPRSKWRFSSRTSSINGEFSSTPCLITGGYSSFDEVLFNGNWQTTDIRRNGMFVWLSGVFH